MERYLIVLKAAKEKSSAVCRTGKKLCTNVLYLSESWKICLSVIYFAKVSEHNLTLVGADMPKVNY